MTTKIDQKAYLQKYLGGPSKDKKKKKKTVPKGKGFKIIDDDLDLSKLRPLQGDELDVFDEGEDAPQIAGIIDERPEDVKKAEQFKSSSKWKVVNQDDGYNSKLQIQEIKKDIKETEKENEIIFGKMYSDSEDEKKDSDPSPPRKNIKSSQDNDLSPPRKRDRIATDRRKETKYDSDQSPPRKNNKSSQDNDLSPPRKRDRIATDRRKETKYDSDQSPPRKNNKSSQDNDLSPPRKRDRIATDRRKETKYDSDQSPPRKNENRETKRVVKAKSRWDNESNNEEQAKRYREKSPDSDLSPPRKNRNTKYSPERNKSDKLRKNSDSDLSPPRKDRNKNNMSERYGNNSHKRQRSADLSPPRRKRDKNTSPTRTEKDRHTKDKKRKHDSDLDLSPPRRDSRRIERDRGTQNNVNDKDRYRNTSDSPPPSNKKMAKTLEGKIAGLQDARQLREENDRFRRKEDEVFKGMADEVSGRNAKAVSRKGKRETSEERNKQKEKAERQKELDEKYKKWSRGLKQIETHESRMQDFLHEASKPLARHRDDRDLESSLKQIERAGDPMLKYIREKKRERGELPPEKPSYKGNFPPNRFNIRPGYRWDGVDRSNGYEKKYFEQQSKRKAQEEEAYKWSTEDL